MAEGKRNIIVSVTERVFAFIADQLAYPIFIWRFLAKNKKIRNGIVGVGLGGYGVNLLLGPEILLFLISMIVQLAFGFFFMIFQFVGIFWFLSRPRTITVIPGENIEGLTLDDYWGQPTLVELVQQWVTILQGDKAFKKMGGEPIRGFLLEGKPGTGKTYLMKCLAGSARIAMHGIEGSSFRAMFWGVDVLRVLNFVAKNAKLAAAYGASIAYIDEIDSIGMARAGVQGGQTQLMGPMGMMGGSGALTTLLAQMDGIGTPNEFTKCRNLARSWFGVPLVEPGFVMFVGATNRPDVLDPALIRPGRLDRRIIVEPPDGPGRKEVFNGYLAKIAHEDINVDTLVAYTQDMTPASIRMAVMRDAVRNARFRDSMKVNQSDIEAALLEQQTGIANPIGDLSEDQRKQIATHEAGHAVALHHLRPDKRLSVISIVRHGGALGFVLHTDVRPTYARPLRDFQNDIMVALAGDVATELCMGERWTGGAMDFQQARALIRNLIFHGYFGPILNLLPTEEIPEDIDKEAREWFKSQIAATETLLVKYRQEVDKIAAALLEKEELTGDEVNKLIMEG